MNPREKTPGHAGRDEMQTPAAPAALAADWMFLQPSVLDEMHEAVIITDLSGIVTACNRAAQAIYGYMAQELIGSSILTLYAEEDRQMVMESVLPAVHQAGRFRGELRNRTRSGDYVYIHLALKLLRDAEGVPAAIAGFSVDVTSQKLSELAMQRGDRAERQVEESTRQQIAGEAENWQLKRVEQELLRANRRLGAVLSSMTEGLAMFDREWRYTFLNEQACRILGVRAGELLGRNLWERYPQAKNSRFWEAYRKVMETGEPVDFDEFYPEPLNKWMACHCVASDDGLSVYFSDITEARHMMQAAEDGERRARLGMYVATLGLAEIDYSTGLSHLSTEAARMYGLGDEALAVPRTVVHGTFHPEDRAELARRIAECLDPAGTGWFSMDHRVVWPTGEVHWLRVRKQVYFSDPAAGGMESRPERAMLAAFDVTAELNAGEHVRASEERFRTLAESLPQLVWEGGGEGKKLYCNQHYLRYTGCSNVEELERRWPDLIHPEDRAKVMETWKGCLGTGEPYHAEYQLLRKDGAYRHFLARALPVKDGADRVKRWLGSLTDIHEQKLAAEALRRSEMIAAAGRLAASVAHEINNPLEALTNLLYIVEGSGTLDATNSTYLQMAQEELRRVSEVTTQSLRFHRQSMAAAAIDVQEILEMVLKLHTRQIGRADLTVVREYQRTEPLMCLVGDLRQALGNVLGNAIDASPAGGRLRIRLRRSVDWKSRGRAGVRVTFADQGSGIRRDQLPHIFEAFYSTKGVTNTGLGLWISEDLVKKCGGTISVSTSTSERHRGSVFSIFLPHCD